MAAAEKKEEKTVKLAKPIVKFIWFAGAVAVALGGYFIRSMTGIPSAAKIVYCVVLVITIIMAAQYASSERAFYGEQGEDGKRKNKKKYFLSSLVYYIFIIFAVFCCFLSLCIINIISL